MYSNYARLLGPIEKMLAGRASAEKVVWNDTLLSSFQECKKALNDIKMIYVPKPTDTLHTYSDYSTSEKAVGGRLEIHRQENGRTRRLLGGHYSCRVNKHQQRWYPCEERPSLCIDIKKTTISNFGAALFYLMFAGL